MTRKVLATGTFDLLHPGHLHYLLEARGLGDELVVIVARNSMIDHKPKPVVPEEQRRLMVEALDPVDEAVLGSEESIFEPLHDIQPDVVALGHDQHHDPAELEEELAERGLPAEVERVGRREVEDEVLSTSALIRKILEERG